MLLANVIKVTKRIINKYIYHISRLLSVHTFIPEHTILARCNKWDNSYKTLYLHEHLQNLFTESGEFKKLSSHDVLRKHVN